MLWSSLKQPAVYMSRRDRVYTLRPIPHDRCETISLARDSMSNWLHNLPIFWMAVVIFGACYLMAAIVFLAVGALARRKIGGAFRGFSPGMLSPLGVIFGLLVAFI